jgi:hypothetical protein
MASWNRTPILEDGRYSTPSTASTMMHFIPDMMSLQNKNNYDLNQRHTQTFSASPYSKKGDPLDEFLEFWRPIIQKMKEILEIKNFLNEFSSCLSQPHIITNLGQTPITRPTIPPVTTTPLQQSPSQPTQSQP